MGSGVIGHISAKHMLNKISKHNGTLYKNMSFQFIRIWKLHPVDCRDFTEYCKSIFAHIKIHN